MATTREQIEELRKEVQRLKAESTETRRILREHGLWPPARSKKTAHLSERERARLILRQAQIVREMTLPERALAAEWQALPPAERQEVEDALRHVKIDPPLSQLIHDLRGSDR